MVWPSLPFLIGYFKFQTTDLHKSDLNSAQAIQAHFLKYNFYIPLENIFTPADAEHLDVSKLCPKAEVLIWTTLKFQVPFWHVFSCQKCFKII